MPDDESSTTAFDRAPPAATDTTKYAYWNAFRVVFVEVLADSSGRVIRTKVSRTHAPAFNDSAKKIVGRMRFDPARDLRHFVDAYIGIVPVAFPQRTEIPTLADHPLFPALRDALERGSLSPWLRAWKTADPLFRMGDFLDGGITTAPEESTEGVSRIPWFAEMLRLGVAVPSPGKKWWLFPIGTAFYGGAPEMDDVMECRIYEAPPGVRTRRHWVGLYERFEWGTWLAPDDYVVVGHSTAFHPDSLIYEHPVPAIWMGNAETRELRSYKGKPQSPPAWKTSSHAIAAWRRSRNPKVNW